MGSKNSNSIKSAPGKAGSGTATRAGEEQHLQCWMSLLSLHLQAAIQHSPSQQAGALHTAFTLSWIPQGHLPGQLCESGMLAELRACAQSHSPGAQCTQGLCHTNMGGAALAPAGASAPPDRAHQGWAHCHSALSPTAPCHSALSHCPVTHTALSPHCSVIHLALSPCPVTHPASSPSSESSLQSPCTFPTTFRSTQFYKWLWKWQAGNWISFWLLPDFVSGFGQPIKSP